MVDKRKKAMTTTAEQAPLKSVLGGNNFKGPTFEERKNKIYPFKRDKVKKIFRDALKSSLQLPKPRRLEEVGKTNDPNYCLYHQMISHPIKDYWVFKYWVEKQYKVGMITLSQAVLTDPPTENTNFVYIKDENNEE
uniref:Uncharacterized protein n=1 Tax=Ananas comosus var. bracteatus TaxID=296719 RepID=A0A6V7Q656_ANACO|nr:unnamed protein product [Ananas comosus var. bracteatus]